LMTEIGNIVRLEDITKNKPSAVCVTTDTTVQETARIVAKKNFRSVPVWDEEEGRYVAFIDEMDLLEYAVVYAHSFEGKELSAGRLREKYSQFTAEEFQRLSFGNGETIDSLLRLPGAERRRIHIFQSNAKLINAMKVIQEHERVLVRHINRPYANSKVKLFVGRLMTRIHRVMEYKICTQTDILRFIFEHNSREIEEEMLDNMKIADCGILGDSVVWITTSDRAIDGYLKMLDTNSNACAVVDQQGRIVASLSASDLRGMTNEKLKSILLPVIQFFTAMTGYKPMAPLVCSPNDMLIPTIRSILKASTRRCWVVDEAFRPLGLLSMGKIISFVVTNPCKHL